MRPSEGSITFGGNNQIPIQATGDVTLKVTDSKGKTKYLELKNVLYTPGLKFNLLSVAAAVMDDFHVSFNRKACAINTSQRFSLEARMAKDANLYQFRTTPTAKRAIVLVAKYDDIFVLVVGKIGMQVSSAHRVR
ncbi:hypothetical protein Poli38472_014826 [Pythium oligandrum]|uniref:Retrovirus-related Pol polyprotein from transposon TNT 1-94-like beta-barrel domain-containing protein n=1 Tax=Pythium oligandrum TaxID=41045 RepID=A0A8K1C779_PYTOL|nr:hypothetical protein Poli38472_014826 [Pythium oligandrum]|eukprot:TMW57693.1 hypothetical protein Poli38472_014826 [Pythium oligandrum]